MIDLAGVSGQVQLAVVHAPAVVDTMLPSRLFDVTFADNTAVLSYRLPEATKGFTAVVANDAIVVGGNVTGSNIVMGNNNKVNNNDAPKKEEPIVVGIFIPASINTLYITGNGKTECTIQCGNAEVTLVHATRK
jgi:hypothetical protein